MTPTTSLNEGAQVLDGEVIASLRELGGDDGGELLNELVQLFFADAPARLHSMVDAALAGDAQGVERAAHAMKSGSANLGAKRLSDLCRRLEEAGRNGAVDLARELVVHAQREYAVACEALSQLVARN